MFGERAEIHSGIHRFQDAVRYAHLGIEFSRNDPLMPGPRAQCFKELAGALAWLGDFQGALQAMQEARALMERVRREDKYPRYISIIVGEGPSRAGAIPGGDGGV